MKADTKSMPSQGKLEQGKGSGSTFSAITLETRDIILVHHKGVAIQKYLLVANVIWDSKIQLRALFKTIEVPKYTFQTLKSEASGELTR